MGKCSLCGNQMLVAPGCIEHELLLSDARVIDAPRHDQQGSLSEEEPTEPCHDCGANPHGIHHPHCDWARQPDGSQVLMELVDYRPKEDPPVGWDQDVIFPVITPDGDGVGQPTPVVTAYENLGDAEDYVADMNEQFDSGYSLAAVRLQGYYDPDEHFADPPDNE